MALYEAFAKQLREQLRERGWTASSLAQRLEIHRSTVNRWVNAETRPDSVDIVILIADELGLSGAKRELFLRAYNGEAAEAASPSAAGALATAQAPMAEHELPSAPAQLAGAIPPPAADFVGRSEEMGRLLAIVKSARSRDVPGMANICGPCGIGKTELAYAAARRVAGFFPDGQLLLRMGGSDGPPMRVHEALYAAVELLDPEAPLPDDATNLKDYYYHLLQRRRVLIVADDARDAAQIVDLLPPPGSALLVTSRQRFTLPGMTLLDLPPLDAPDAAALALSLCPRMEAHALELARLCGCLPLALRLAAGVLARDPARSVGRWLAALHDDRLRLLQLQAAGPLGGKSLEDSLRTSYAALDLPAQSVLQQLSIFPGSFDLSAALVIVELPPDGTAGSPAMRSPLEMILGLLYRRSLLDWDQRLERYAMQPLVRAFSWLRLEQEQEVLLRYARYYAQLAARAAELYGHGGDAQQMGLALFDRERAHIDATWRWALGAGLGVMPLAPGGRPPGAYEPGFASPGAAPAAAAVSREAAALALTIALASEVLGPLRYDLQTELLPLLQASLQLAAQIQDEVAEGRLACALSMGYASLDPAPSTLSLAPAWRALELARERDDQRLKVAALIALAATSRAKRGPHVEHSSREDLLAEALRTAGSQGDLGGSAAVYGEQAMLLRAEGQLEEAEQALGQSLALARQSELPHLELAALERLALLAEQRGDRAGGAAWGEQALALARRLGDQRAIARLAGLVAP